MDNQPTLTTDAGAGIAFIIGVFSVAAYAFWILFGVSP